MPKPISYTLTKNAQGTRLSILPSETTRDQRQGFVIAGVSAAIGILTLFLFGIGVLTILVALFSFLVAAVIAWGVCERFARRELLFLPDRLILTSSVSVFKKTRVVPLLSIDHFGFGNFGHSGTPVLKFTVDDKWTVLASNVAESDANHVVQRLASEGITFPKSSQ